MLKQRNSVLKDRLIEKIYECETELGQAKRIEKLIETGRNTE